MGETISHMDEGFEVNRKLRDENKDLQEQLNSREKDHDKVVEQITFDYCAKKVKLQAQLDAANAKVAEAVRYLREGKAKFTPHTTNSDVDCFLKRCEEQARAEG